MSNTQLLHFKKTLLDFKHDLLIMFPGLKEKLEKYYSDDKINNGDIIENVKDIMLSLHPYIENISKNDENLFKTNDKIYFLKGINFKKIWKQNLNEHTKISIWRYLNNLYMRSYLILKMNGELKDFLNIHFDEDNPEDYSKIIFENMKKLNEKGKKSQMSKENFEQSANHVKNILGANDNNIFGKIINDVGKELHKTMTENSMRPEDILTGLLTGNPDNKIVSMMEGIGKNVEQQLKNKEVNENELLNASQKMMNIMQNDLKDKLPGFGGNTTLNQESQSQVDKEKEIKKIEKDMDKIVNDIENIAEKTDPKKINFGDNIHAKEFEALFQSKDIDVEAKKLFEKMTSGNSKDKDEEQDEDENEDENEDEDKISEQFQELLQNVNVEKQAEILLDELKKNNNE